MAASAMVGGLAMGWQGGWLGVVGTAGVMTVGLGLPWLKREAAQGGAIVEDFEAQALPRVSGRRGGPQ